MHYCSHCGTQLAPNALFCSNCGQAVAQPTQSTEQTQPEQQTQEASAWPFAILSFFFPIIGLILYLVWHDSLPRRARYAGVGAIIGVCLPILSVIFLVSLFTFFLFLRF